MATPILHHHDPSPFAEKIRLCFGIKGLAWRSVQVSMVMPRPALSALTGGYRKIPVMQIGADIYCDTRLIVRELERRYPTPSLFPGGSMGLSLALTAWSDRIFFDPGAGLSMGLNRSSIPSEVIDDRKSFFNFMDFDQLEQDIPHLRTQFRAGLAIVEMMLEDGRAYVLGESVSYADINAYFPIWMARGNFGDAAAVLAEWPKLRAWEQRMQSFGNGHRSEISADAALEEARDSHSEASSGVDVSDSLGLRHGCQVSVVPTDYGCIPVVGELRSLDGERVVVNLRSPETGEIAVHFPRLGYRVNALA